MKIKTYQVALLSFALGIFGVTLLFGLMFKRHIDYISTEDNQASEFSDKEKLKVKVFFSSSLYDPQHLDCNKVYPVEREVSALTENKNSRVGEFVYLTVSELLKGPTTEEKKDGFFTSLPEGVKVNNISIDTGVAMVDFNEILNRGSAGSCRVGAIRSQITETLKQFPGVEKVIISIEGNSEDILQP